MGNKLSQFHVINDRKMVSSRLSIRREKKRQISFHIPADEQETKVYNYFYLIHWKKTLYAFFILDALSGIF